MPYIGNEPTEATFVASREYLINVTTAQSDFTLPDAYTYTVGVGALELFLDGWKLTPTEDFVEMSNLSFSLTFDAQPGQEILAKLTDTGLSNSAAETIIFQANGVGAVARSVTEKLRESVSVKDFGAVGDGTADDTAAIQAAEDAASAISGIVVFPPGTYAISDSIQKKANSIWYGPGKIKRIDNASPTGSDFSLVVADGVDNWAIDGVDFENIDRTTHIAAGLTSSSATPGGLNSCIDVNDCEYWRVENCDLRKFTYGIITRNNRYFNIHNNKLIAETGKTVAQIEALTYTPFASYASTGGIVFLFFGGAAATASKGFRITNNYVEVPGLDSGIEYVMMSWDKQPSVIANNMVRGAHGGIVGYRGALADPGSAPTYNTASIIANNHVYACWEQGIYIRGIVGVIVANNHLELCAQGGANGDLSAVSLCCRINPFQPSLSSTFVSAGAGDVSNDHAIVISGNRIVDHGREDIACDPSVLIELDNVLFRNNAIVRSDEKFSTARGIAIYACNGKELRKVTITDNQINGVWSNGIFVSDGAKDASIETDFIEVSRNQIYGTFEYGIRMSWCSFNCRMVENILQGTFTTAGISIRSTPYSEIRGNYVRGGVVGIRAEGFNLASDTAYHTSRRAITGARRRGGTLTVEGNQIWDASGGAFTAVETNADDTTFEGRCFSFKDNFVDGTKLYTSYSGGTPPSTGNAKTWTKFDTVLNSSIASGQPWAKICTVSGGYGSTTTSTGDTTTGSPTITNVSSLDGYGPGIYITATGFSGVVKVIAIDTVSSTITVDANAASDNTGVTLTLATPTFVATANMA